MAIEDKELINLFKAIAQIYVNTGGKLPKTQVIV